MGLEDDSQAAGPSSIDLGPELTMSREFFGGSHSIRSRGKTPADLVAGRERCPPTRAGVYGGEGDWEQVKRVVARDHASTF